MQQQPSGTTTFLQRLASIVHSLRYILLGVLGALVVLIITWAIVIEVRSNRTESATVLAEHAQERLDEWIDEEDEEKKAIIAEELQGTLLSIIDTYPRLYATQRAYHIQGSFLFRSEQWEVAANSFLDLAEKFPKSYLAPISIVNAAVSYEEAEQDVRALETYRRIIDEFAEVSPEIPRVLFSLGRLSETVGTTQQALEYYTRLVDEYSTSSWTNLARDRIIYLNLD
jgi:tetratricopeptide (TPR) repeat protein